MSKVSSLLEKIFQCKGANIQLWESLKNILQNDNLEIEPFCYLIKRKINNSNKSDTLLALNLLDFAVDTGQMLLWKIIDSKDFLSCIINILKQRLDADLQTVALYLIQKWAFKFQNYPSIQNSFNTYNTLKKCIINFPKEINNSYKDYLNKKVEIKGDQKNYIDNSDIINQINKNKNNTNVSAIDNNSLRISRMPSDPNEYLKNINIDFINNNFDKKYLRLVSKLNDWTVAIQEINILIDNNINGQNNLKLQPLCENLQKGKEKLNNIIQSDKINDEKLMEISLNVSEDMNMTLNRYDKSKKGQNPGPFLTSFLRDDNPNYNNNVFLNRMIRVDANDYAKKYNTTVQAKKCDTNENTKKNNTNIEVKKYDTTVQAKKCDINENAKKNNTNLDAKINENAKKQDINDLAEKLKYQNPQEQIKKLGFGDTITTKYNFGEQSSLNINNSNNTLNGLFGQMVQSKVMDTSKEMGNANLFTSMSNSNLNLTQNSINSIGNGAQNMLLHSNQFPNNRINLNDSNIHIIGNAIKDNNNNYLYNSEILNNNKAPIINFNNYNLNQGNKNNNFYNSQMLPSFHMNLNNEINPNNNNIYNTTIIK